MIHDVIVSLGVWNWFVLAILLLGVEVLAPGTFILWLGAAALATGVLTLIVDLSWQIQLIAFSVLSVLAVLGWWLYPGRTRKGAKEPILQRRADIQIGREFILEEPIVQGAGRVRIDDSVWRISGPDLPAGAKIRVAATDGPLLKVVPL
jgi:membrane protein implicated in regulation of membrane protease activity